MKKAKRLIVFFVPKDKLVSGGVLSVFSIAKVSREFKKIHGAEVVLSVPPGFKSYGKNDLFKNDETIYSFDDIVKNGPYESLLLQIPEYASYDTYMALKKYSEFIASIPKLHVNIMNQNILIMQPPEEVALWFSLTPNVTQTTAHNKYSTQELADKYAIPTHHLSTFVDQSQYTMVPYERKKKIIALSPDLSKLRGAIEQKLKELLPEYQVTTIQNMTYENYKKFIASAKYTITFGEGFDGYYVEGFFTGGVTFAVYNPEFFPDKDFATFGNVFSSDKELLESVVTRIRSLDQDKKAYESLVQQNLEKINALYSYKNYRHNIELFYEHKYKLQPSPGSMARLLGHYIKDTEQRRTHDQSEIKRLSKAVADMEVMIADKSRAIADLDEKIIHMEQSKSWKVTKPLRKASSMLGKNKS